MTHDYAKKKKPATRPKKSRARKSQVPGWVWLFTGIVTGIFICFLVYLAGLSPQRAPKTAAKTAKTVESHPATTESTATKFDFYTLLPEREVIVPDEPQEDSGPAEATVFILQAGSFKNAEDADRLRARLILMGMDARVEAVTVNGGDQWHRVQVGPFNDRSHMSRARSTLIAEGIDTLVMKRKAG